MYLSHGAINLCSEGRFIHCTCVTWSLFLFLITKYVAIFPFIIHNGEKLTEKVLNLVIMCLFIASHKNRCEHNSSSYVCTHPLPHDVLHVADFNF